MACAYILYYTVFLFYREENGLRLFPALLRTTLHSTPVLLATVAVAMAAVWAAAHVSTHTHTVILTGSASVTEEVKHMIVQSRKVLGIGGGQGRVESHEPTGFFPPHMGNL